jgi:hypothetical protein
MVMRTVKEREHPAVQSRAVAVAGARSVYPPTPEECSHPQPVSGVMAHEFAHYEGAIGPEGTRRTVTYYGPVIGGLPIHAWHCEICGLLRLEYPDGRREERRLHPGPQPGLIAELSPLAPEKVLYGMQPRVSGLTAQPRVFEELVLDAGLAPAPVQLPRIVLPAWDAVTWLLVAGLSGIALALFALGLLAVYSFRTPPVVLPLTVIVSLSFVGLMVFALGVAGVRHFFPAGPLLPSIAESARGKPQLGAATKTALTLLVLSVAGFFAAGVLAVYWFATPGAEWPVFLASLGLAVSAAVIEISAAAWRHFVH